MEVFFNKSTDKADKLIEAISKADGRKNYHLKIFTCYLAKDLEQISDFFKRILGTKKNIKSIELFIDSRQCVKSGIQHLEIYVKDFNKRNLKKYGKNLLKIYAIDTPQLFHTKAYILQSNDKESGLIALGSANFSSGGLFGNKDGNFESLIISEDPKVVTSFLASESIQEYKIELSQLEEYKTINYTFKYAMLREGMLIHQWADTLNQYFSVKYTLTEEGKNQNKNNVFSIDGFSIDSETISRQFLDFDDINSNYKFGLNRLLGKGLETSSGHWIPKKFLYKLSQNDTTDSFYEDIKNSIEQQMVIQLKEMIRIYSKFLDFGYIKPNSKSPYEVINNKLNELENDSIRLNHFKNRFAIKEIPYDFSDTANIKALYKEIEVAINKSKRKKEASKLFLKAVKYKKPSLINDDGE